MRFGLGVLHLSPSDFWSMTPRELACAIEAATAGVGTPVDRASFNDLMERFPDG
jgi:uncharacterized phage protein (TIGR02216 family)